MISDAPRGAGSKRCRSIPTEMPPRRDFYRPVEACSILHIGMATLYRRMAAGDILTSKVGGVRLISHAEIERLPTPRTLL